MDDQARTSLNNVYDSIIREHAIAVKIHMPAGIPYDEIGKAAEAMPIDLVVIGTHGTSGLRELFIGTTAYTVVKNTIKPVLTIPGDFGVEKCRKILFPERPQQGIKTKFKFLLPFFLKTEASNHLAVLSLDGEAITDFENEKELDAINTCMENEQVRNTEKMYNCKNFAEKALELAEIHEADLIVINASLDYNCSPFFIDCYMQQIIYRA